MKGNKMFEVSSTTLDALEQPLLRVPAEALKKAAKERKAVLDETQQAIANTLTPSEPSRSADKQADQLDSLGHNLQGLKRKLGDVSRAESAEAGRCKARLEHLQELTLPKPSAVAWNKQRLDRLLVDHLNRSGYQRTASFLASSSGIEDLVDSHIFKDAKKVIDALRQHDCSEALAWCAEQRPRLKKAKSKLEFQLRVQEFIELVRRKEKVQAIHYAREHLAPWASQYLQEFQRAVATLAFSPDTKCAVYRALFDPCHWETLEQQFMQELYRMHSLPPKSQLLVHLQAGLSALKMPPTNLESCSRDDPLHLPSFQVLSKDLPYSKHVHSKLLCSVTRTMLSDANPPVVLPNGYVYSQQAVDMISEQHHGRMVCPKTGSSYSLDELRRAFIV